MSLLSKMRFLSNYSLINDFSSLEVLCSPLALRNFLDCCSPNMVLKLFRNRKLENQRVEE